MDLTILNWILPPIIIIGALFWFFPKLLEASPTLKAGYEEIKSRLKREPQAPRTNCQHDWRYLEQAQKMVCIRCGAVRALNP